MSSLPEEIEVDIFLRLPVESIVACKYVCKPWFKIISSSKFIKDHFTQNENNHRFMFLNREPKKPWIWSMDFASVSSPGTSKPLEAVPLDCPFRYDEHSEIRILGSCNGLICLGIYTPYVRVPGTYGDNICVWNPATREYKNIPLPSYPSNVRGPYYNHNDYGEVIYGFGCDFSIDNYKLVKIAHSKRSGYIKSEILTLGSDLWKPIKHAGCCYSSLSTSPGMLLNGTLHWEGVTTKQKKSYRTIVSFNISNERFIELPYPEETVHENPKVGVLDRCLCCLSYGVSSREIVVWVMVDYGVKESWTKQFTFSYDQHLYNAKPLRSLQTGEILMHALGSFILCDPNNRNSLRKLKFLSLEDRLEGGIVYAESLISLNSGNYVGGAKHVASKRLATRTYMQALTGNQKF